MSKDKASAEEIKAKITEAQEAEAAAREEAKAPIEKFVDYREAVREFLNTTLARFNLKIRNVGDTEFIVYQGTLSNVWARFNLREKIFYRTTLERQFERVGLLEPSNDVVIHR